jgi:hypothetical protein
VIVNYCGQDVLGILRALPFFSLVLFVPGYMAGVATDVFGFRRARIAERIALALVLSAAISPYLISILCRALSVPTVSSLFLSLGLFFLTHAIMEWRRYRFRLPHSIHWTTKIFACMVAAWLLICVGSLADIQLGQKLYSTVAIYDHGVRSAFIASAQRTGAPPANPFFYPGTPVPSRYYYYWYVLCAIPAHISGETSRVTLYSSCFWGGSLLAAMIPLYLKHFLKRTSRLRVTALIGVGLLAVTGLDLLPMALLKFGTRNSVPPPDMEWWDPVQVSSWLDALIWVPLHVASLVACLVAFLLLWKMREASSWKQRFVLLALAALGFSSAAGLSVLVTLTFALFVIAWIASLLAHRKFRDAFTFVLAGASSLCLSMFYLRDLVSIRVSSSGQGGERPFSFALRKLPYALSDVPAIIGHKSVFATRAVYLLLVVFVLFIELGVYFVIGFYRADYDWNHRKSLSDADKALWTMALSGLFAMVFLRSTVIPGNDLGVRGALLLQFVLLLWTAIYLSERIPSYSITGTQTAGKPHTLTLVILIVLGAAGSGYQLWTLRTFAYFNEKSDWRSGLGGVGEIPTGQQSFQIRSAYAALDRITDQKSVVQYNPESTLRLFFLQYSAYQAVDAMYSNCATTFGGSLSDCLRVQGVIKTVFDPGPSHSLSKSEVDDVCQSLGINFLVVSTKDPIWNNTSSWVWQSTPTIKNDFVRIYGCGESSLPD